MKAGWRNMYDSWEKYTKQPLVRLKGCKARSSHPAAEVRVRHTEQRQIFSHCPSDKGGSTGPFEQKTGNVSDPPTLSKASSSDLGITCKSPRRIQNTPGGPTLAYLCSPVSHHTSPPCIYPQAAHTVTLAIQTLTASLPLPQHALSCF